MLCAVLLSKRTACIPVLLEPVLADLLLAFHAMLIEFSDDPFQLLVSCI